MKFTPTLILLLSILFLGCQKQKPQALPNILWLTSEDNSPFAGCYGDTFATTPNLDKLAADGFLYTHAYANAPVCAPARNTILTGVYACSAGNQHMRSYYPKSETVKPYPLYLREMGYFCTNNSKTDYNIGNFDPNAIWDECGKKAHYKNRGENQPFFAVFNTGISHESCIHKSIPNDKLRHNPEQVPIAPYHPRTEEMKHDWAQYYDKVEDMDAQIGKWLDELEAAGLAENTIVFYYGDHGGVLARSKRYVYETGTRVPFIVRIPEKYKKLFPAKQKGEKVDRLISFVDLVPTLLSIAGIEIPEHLQGNAFLGEQKTEAPEYAYMFRGRMDERYDMSRAVRDKQFRYIRNYMPHRIYGQPLEYLFKAPSVGSWRKAYDEGKCNAVQSAFWQSKPAEELYDTENDPWEINNLATDPKYASVLKRMRQANQTWMKNIKDTGFIPEPEQIERTGKEVAMYDYMRSEAIDIDKIQAAAELASAGKTENINQLITLLNDEDSAIRYWGATGLLILGEQAKPATPALKNALNDPSEVVSVVAAESLFLLKEKDDARNALLNALTCNNSFARCQALNTIDCLNDSEKSIQQGVIKLLQNAKNASRKDYDIRAARGLMLKWKLNPEDYQINLGW